MSNIIVGACTADLHFGAFNPQRQYQILQEQFIRPILHYPQLDYILIAGDVYDHKMMGNSDGLYYASLIFADIVSVAKLKNAVVLVLHGTFSHDADQLKNLYHYMRDEGVDVRVITQLQFENIKGMRVLCIPELYGVPEELYQKYLTYSDHYDMAFLHGTFEGAVYGNRTTNDRLFTMNDFLMCDGLMIGGHIHTPGCFGGYFYYTGSPYRWVFGEEQEKGFLVTLYDIDTHRHHVQFLPIQSDTYITIDINQAIGNPKDTIDYITKLKKERGMNYLKIKFNIPISGADKVIINNHFRGNATTFVEFMDIVEERKYEQRENGEIPEMYNFLLDDNIHPYEKFVKYVNIKEGSEFITVDKLKEVLSDSFGL